MSAAADLELRLAGLVTPGPLVSELGAVDHLRPGGGVDAHRRARAIVHVASDILLVGPFGPDSCGNCLAMRWQRLRRTAFREAIETGHGTAAAAGSARTEFPGFVVEAVRRLLDEGRAHVVAHQDTIVFGLPIATLRPQTAELLPDPLCGVCAVPEPEPPFLLAPRPKPEPTRYRLRSAASYDLPEKGLINPICGALGGGLVRDGASPTTAPVSGGILLRSDVRLSELSYSGQATSARLSRRLALLEGLERYAGSERRSVRSPLIAAYRDFGRDEALDPRVCGDYDPATYREDPDLAPFDPSEPIPWLRGHSLRDRRPVWVPVRLVHYFSGGPDDSFVDETSSGCAIGGCVEEAILFGLLELVERDSFLLGWYSGAKPAELDLDSCDSAEVRLMRDRAILAGYDLHVYDSTTDVGIPAVTSLAVRRDGGLGRLSFAGAASLDPVTAVESAISEVLTYLPQLPQRVRERETELRAMAEDYSLVDRLADHSALFGLPEMAASAGDFLESTPSRTLADGIGVPHTPRSDLTDDLMFCCQALEMAGFEIIVVDLTAPEQARMGLRTVRVLVPGLLPIDFGWSRQRALRMPRLLGSATTLRRIPHPFP